MKMKTKMMKNKRIMKMSNKIEHKLDGDCYIDINNCGIKRKVKKITIKEVGSNMYLTVFLE